MPEKATSRVSGVINTAEIYPRDEFLARMRWGKHAWRTAKRNGLRVLRAGGRVYVLGSDVAEYLSHMNDGGRTR